MESKPSIVFVLADNNNAGGTITAYRQAAYLASLGEFHVKIYYVNFDVTRGTYPGLDDRVQLVTDENIKQKTLEQNHDLVIFTWWKTCLEIAKFKSRKFAYFIQSDERRFYLHQGDELESRNYSVVEQTYKNFPGELITITGWLRDMFQDEFGAKSSVAPIGIDPTIFNQGVKPLAQNTGKVRVLIEGPREVAFKRTEFAQMCIAPFREDVEIWHVSNDGLFRNYWHADRVFSGVPHAKMPAIMASCDFLLKLSVVEGFFAPPLEMFALGKTALTSNVTGSEEYLVNNHNALVVPMDDYAATTAALRNMINNKDLRMKLSSNAIHTASLMTWDKQHNLFSKAISKILGREMPTDGVKLKKLIKFAEKYNNDAMSVLKSFTTPEQYFDNNVCKSK